MAELLTPDLCIIGGGSAGLSAAATARAFGASVVLVEKGEMGGDCLNTGCVPSKSLIAASRLAEAGRRAAGFGVSFEPPRINFGRIHDHVSEVIASIAPNDSVERFEGLGVTIIRGRGRFVDKRTLEADGRSVRARRFVIAAGSRPAIPSIPGIDGVDYLTNETIFDQTRKPAHLIIIGGGPIGMELAQAHHRLGSEVTVIETADFLAKDDPELVGIATRRMQEEGVALMGRTAVIGIVPSGNGIAVTVENERGSETVVGSHLLVAAGRRPNIEDLGLDAAHVRTDRRGVVVDASMRSSNRRIYAIGDIAGGLQFTHAASYHAGLVIRSALFGLPARENRTIVPWCTFIDPEIAAVGLGEAEALRRYPDTARILRWSYGESDRARAERRTDGLIKLITLKNGRILGCTICGEGAGEMISLFAYALANRLKVGSLMKFVAPYPTLAEMARRVAVEHYRGALGSPWIGRWLGLVRLLP
ncbi:MAG: FAD-dependent oxidoreductase [Alphaproteobacteria bacterium]|nr:FAD-dependent oxidoreductase [Alphaproteobacteria bacterium]